MTTYYYDKNGWMTSDIIEGRSTEEPIPGEYSNIRKVGKIT